MNNMIMQTIPEWLGIIIILSPLTIFIILTVTVHRILTRQGVKLSNLLAETEVIIKKEEDAEEADDSSKDQKNIPIKRSASRLVLFLSGITAIVLATCITSFYFFINIYCIDCAMDLDLADFTNILLALGIGVVPYAVNQVKRIRL